jgi:hypothetical protein
MKTPTEKFLEENFDYERGIQGNMDYFHNVLGIKISLRTLHKWMSENGIYYRGPYKKDEK